jgi:FemAB-related protein (PEP-CTERM system-associated)
MNVRLAEAKDGPLIDRFVDESGASSVYHYSRWQRVVEESFGHKWYCLVCEEEPGRVVGTLPMVHMDSFLFGNFLVSMPYFNYGGVCADDPAVRSLLVEGAVRKAEELRAGHVEFRQEIPLSNGFPVKTAKVSMRLALPGSGKDLWESLPSKLKSQVRRPQKEGMTVRVGGLEELEHFHRIFSVNMRDLGTPVYPVRFFRHILEQFPRNSWICTVMAGEIAVASGFLIGFKGNLEIPWASSIRKYNRLGPNMLLYWSCLEFACERGFRVFDFGRSSVDGGTYRFKEQWGASPHPLYWHYWTREGTPVPDMTPGNPKYQLAIHVWKKLPLPVTRFLGPLIVRNLP